MPIHSAFLRYFDEVRKCGSIRQAARNLYVASSAVNRRILKVEAELGVKLLERSRSGVRLTGAGEQLAQHVERTLSDARRTLANIRTLNEAGQESITIVAQESVIAHFLPPALVALHADFPEVATAFKAAGGWQLNDLLLTESADIALAFDARPAPGVTRVASCALPVGAVMSPRHPLATQPRVALEACAAYPIVLPDESWPLRNLLDRELAERALRPKVITSSNSVEFLRTMLDQELGIGFQTVIGLEGKLQRGELVLVPLAGDRPIEQVFSICVRDDQPRTASFTRATELLCERMAEYQTTE